MDFDTFFFTFVKKGIYSSRALFELIFKFFKNVFAKCVKF